MTLIIETAPGVKFTNHAKEFNKGGYAGFVRKGKNGMLFMDADKQPKAFLSKYDGGFFVTAFKSEADGGRTRYMYGLSDASRDFIGLSDATYTAETQRANEMVRQHYL